MKRSVFNIFRKTEIKSPEKGGTRKRRRISAAASYSERQYRYSDIKRSVTKNSDNVASSAKEEFHFPKIKGFHFPTVQKRRFVFIVAIAIVAVVVPVIFATAANSNGVAKIAEIDLQPTSSAAVQDDTSDLFSGVNQEALEATTDGELTSDLTESSLAGEVPAADGSNTVIQNAAAADPNAAAADPNAAAATDPNATAATDPNATAATDPNATAMSAESIYQTYTEGMEDPFVSMIQQRLMDLDYMESDETTYKFGPITAQAIQYFQRKNGLPVDGIAGPGTQEVLFSNEALYYTVSEGASGLDVESIQERLEELGYNVSTTGYFGTETTAAVQAFQRMNDLNDDGNVGSGTREILYSSDAEPAPEGKKSSAGSSHSSGSGSDSDNLPAANPGSVEAFINAALAQLGDPYVRGGKGPDSFDCSGLVYYALQASGNGIGYMTSGGWAGSGYTRIDNMGDLQRGDVICVSGHVAIYLGGGDVVHASSSNGCVVYGNIGSNYWSSNWICGRRPL